TKAKVDPCGAGFERRGSIIEGRRAGAEQANSLSRKPVEVDVVGRVSIKLPRKVGDEVGRSSPTSAAFNAGYQDNFSRINRFDPACPTETGEEKVAGWFDRCYLCLIFDRKFENISVPIEISAPYFRRKIIDVLPCLTAETRLVPGTRREARDAKVGAI